MEQLLLLEKVHLTFESWFLRQFQQGLLEEELVVIDLRELRSEYLQLCWKEEHLWKEWSNGIQQQVEERK